MKQFISAKDANINELITQALAYKAAPSKDAKLGVNQLAVISNDLPDCACGD